MKHFAQLQSSRVTKNLIECRSASSFPSARSSCFPMNANAHNSGPFRCRAAVTTNEHQSGVSLEESCKFSRSFISFSSLVSGRWEGCRPKQPNALDCRISGGARAHCSNRRARCSFLAAGPGRTSDDSSMVESPAKSSAIPLSRHPFAFFKKFIQSDAREKRRLRHVLESPTSALLDSKRRTSANPVSGARASIFDCQSGQ